MGSFPTHPPRPSSFYLLFGHSPALDPQSPPVFCPCSPPLPPTPPLALPDMHPPPITVTAGCYAERGNGMNTYKYATTPRLQVPITPFEGVPLAPLTSPTSLSPSTAPPSLAPLLPLLHPLCSFTLQKQVDEFCHISGLRQAEAGGVALK